MKDLRVIEDAGVAMVTAHGDFNPLQHLRRIAFELEIMKFRGAVVFDLLSCNGLSSNRFVQILFDGASFDRGSFSVIEDLDKKLRQEQDTLFRSNPEFLTRSVLSSLEISNF